VRIIGFPTYHGVYPCRSVPPGADFVHEATKIFTTKTLRNKMGVATRAPAYTTFLIG
jgi:hypothetical protein